MSKIATITQLSPLYSSVEQIQVSGSRCFNGSLWREAILFFLNGIWSGDDFINSRPKIYINNTTMKLGSNMGPNPYPRYYADIQDNGKRPQVKDSEIFVVHQPTQAEVENGLIKFVKNNQIRMLVIMFPESGPLFFTKGHKRSELYITAE